MEKRSWESTPGTTLIIRDIASISRNFWFLQQVSIFWIFPASYLEIRWDWIEVVVEWEKTWEDWRRRETNQIEKKKRMKRAKETVDRAMKEWEISQFHLDDSSDKKGREIRDNKSSRKMPYKIPNNPRIDTGKRRENAGGNCSLRRVSWKGKETRNRWWRHLVIPFTDGRISWGDKKGKYWGWRIDEWEIEGEGMMECSQKERHK